MEALVEHADINVDNVAVLQGTRIGNAVADAFVHGTGKSKKDDNEKTQQHTATSEKRAGGRTVTRDGHRAGKKEEALIRKVQK